MGAVLRSSIRKEFYMVRDIRPFGLWAMGYMTEQLTLTSKEQAVTVPFVGFTDANGSGCRRCQPPSLENTNDIPFFFFFFFLFFLFFSFFLFFHDRNQNLMPY